MASDVRERRHARVLAIQALYSMEIEPVPSTQAVRTAARLAADEEDFVEGPEVALALGLVERVRSRQDEIDVRIGESGTSWRVDRMSPLDLQILRVATAELLEGRSDTPTAVVIDEAIEIARSLGGDGTTAFVNGILDAIARGLSGTTVFRERHEER